MASVRLNPGTQEYQVGAKLAGFDTISFSADPTDFTDTRSTITLEAFAVDAKGQTRSIARVVSVGGVRETTHHITGKPLENPHLLTVVTESTREYKSDVTVRLTVEGAAARISIPQIVTA